MKLGVVVPAFNEEEYLVQCITSLNIAIENINNSTVDVKVVVVLDSCSDQSIKIVQDLKISYLECDFSCVGKARDLGIRFLIDKGIDWIACTDADSSVEKDWLIQQLSLQPVDIICGIVVVDDWSKLSQRTKQEYLKHYNDEMDHRHIHGANLSFSKDAYLKVGGFKALACHEDVDLINRMQSLGLNLIWSNKVRVKTSSRLNSRVSEGFSSFLRKLETDLS